MPYQLDRQLLIYLNRMHRLEFKGTTVAESVDDLYDWYPREVVDEWIANYYDDLDGDEPIVDDPFVAYSE